MTASAGTEKWRRTPINPGGTKVDYSNMEAWHPDNELNDEYIAAGAADDHETPLCTIIHEPGVICKRLEGHK